MYLALDDNRCDRFLFIGILLTVVGVVWCRIWAPKAAAAIMVSAAGGLLSVWIADRLLFSRDSTAGWVRTPVTWVLGFALATMLVAVAPLPAWMIEAFSPQVLAERQQALDLIGAVTGEGSAGTLWVHAADYRYPVLARWFVLAAGAALFLLALNTVRSRFLSTALMIALIGAGLSAAVAAAFLPDDRTGGWGALACTLPVLVGLAAAPQGRIGSAPANDGSSARSLAERLSPEGWDRRRIGLWAAAVLNAAGLLVCAPPAAFIATGGGIAAVSILMVANRRRSWSGIVMSVVGLVLLAYGFLADDSIATGAGAIDPFCTPSLPGAGTVKGLFALFLMALVGGAYLWQTVPVWQSRRDGYAVGVGAGVVAALVAAVFGRIQGSSAAIAADPMSLAVVSALGFTAVFRHGSGLRERVFYPLRPIEPTGTLRVVGTVGVALLLAGTVFGAGLFLPTPWNDPAASAFRRARAALSAGDIDAGIAHAGDALQRCPVSGAGWHLLGRLLARKTDDPVDYVNRWLPLADRCMDMAVRYSTNHEQRLFAIASYWVQRAGLLPASDRLAPETTGADRTAAIGRFQLLFQQALAIDPSRWPSAAQRIHAVFPDDRTVLGIVPPQRPELQGEILRWLARRTEGRD